MRGPKPQPTIVKMLRGNPGQRKLNLNEPRNVPLTVDCPPELEGDPEAVREWTRIAPLLIQSGQVTAADRGILIAYCATWGAWRALDAKADADPADTARALKLWIATAVEIGLTPSSRSRVTAKPAEPKASKWAGILK